MADMSKLHRRRSTLGSPPPPEEASTNLSAPETAPIETTEVVAAASPTPVKTARAVGKVRIDARTRRRSGRHVQFATRVSWDWDERLRRIAERDGLLLVEVLERSLDAYEASKAAGKQIAAI